MGKEKYYKNINTGLHEAMIDSLVKILWTQSNRWHFKIRQFGYQL